MQVRRLRSDDPGSSVDRSAPPYPLDLDGEVPVSPSTDPGQRGYFAVYRENETNHCPGCGRSQWLLGRVAAECAFCATAIPFDLSSSRESGKPRIVSRGEGGGRGR
jgi:hypothetical protein